MQISDDDPPKRKVRPRLTVRFAAEQLKAKPTTMRRALKQQKYPKEGASVFMTPYYQKALTTLRHFYKEGPSAVEEGLAKVLSIGQATKRRHNERVIRAFVASGMPERHFNILPNKPFWARVGGVELKLSPDLRVDESGRLRYLYVNCKEAEYPPETARFVLEIACFVMWQLGQDVSPDQFEFVDLFTKLTYTINEVRQSTVALLLDETTQVLNLWNDV